MSEGSDESKNSSVKALDGSTFFVVCDENNDGYVTKDEIKRISDKSNIEYKITDEAFKNIDFNKDGKISKIEWAFGLYGKDELTKENFKFIYGDEEGETMFKKYDTDKDGKVTRSEAVLAQERETEVSLFVAIAMIVVIVAFVIMIFAMLSNAEEEEKDNRSASHNLNSFDASVHTIL